MVRLASMPGQVCAVRNCSKHPPNLHLMNRAITVYWCQKSTLGSSRVIAMLPGPAMAVRGIPGDKPISTIGLPYTDHT